MEIEEAIDRLYDGIYTPKKGMLACQTKNIRKFIPFYKIQASMNNNELLNILRQGKFLSNAISVTIPEGEWSYRPIAASIASQLGYIREIQGFFAEFLSFVRISIDTSSKVIARILAFLCVMRNCPICIRQ